MAHAQAGVSCETTHGERLALISHQRDEPRHMWLELTRRADIARESRANRVVSRLLPDDPSVANLLLLAATETATEAGMASLVAGLREVL